MPAELPSSLVPAERLRRLPSWLVNQLAARANRLVSARLGRPGMRTDYAVLATLDEFGPASQAELGRRVMLDRSDMVALINGLEGQGLVVRRRDEEDRRRNAVTITDEGRAELETLGRLVEQAQDELLDPLTAQERAQLVALLQRVVGSGSGAR